MAAYDIAKASFDRAMAEADTKNESQDAVARCMLDFVVRKYLEYRPLADIQSELRFVADNCDPETDFVFMRP